MLVLWQGIGLDEGKRKPLWEWVYAPIGSLRFISLFPGSETVEHLRQEVHAWLHLHSGLDVTFCADRAYKHLRELGVGSVGPSTAGAPPVTG